MINKKIKRLYSQMALTFQISLTNVKSKAIELKKKYQKLKNQFRKTKESLTKEIEEKSRLIDQIKTHLKQIQTQKDIIDNFSQNQNSNQLPSFDPTEKTKLIQKIEILTAKNEEIEQKYNKLLQEKKNIEKDFSNKTSLLTQAKEEIETLYSNLHESCTGFLGLKKQLEEKLNHEYQLERDIVILKQQISDSEKKYSLSMENFKTLQNERDLAVKKGEEFKNKIITSDETAYLFNVYKETIFGREMLLV